MPHSAMMKIAFCLGLFFFPLNVQAFPSDPLTTVDLESPVHFLAADGSDVEIPSGTYGVESAEEWIRLVPEERRNAFLIEANRRTHPLNIESPVAMSFPGENESEADFHFVMLLLPGGESLEAAGTYSGIRPRGFNVGQAFNNAKKTATNTYNQAKSTANKASSTASNAAQQAAQQAQQQAQQAASTAQKGLQGAQAAALLAKQAVEQGAKQAGQAIGGGVQTQLNNIQNNPLVAKLESEIQTLEAVRKLNLEPLFACFRQSSGQAPLNFPQMVHQFTTNPPDFANQLFQDIMRQWEQSFSEVMAEQLQFIRTPSRSAPQGPQIIGMAFRSIEKLAQKAPGGKCLMQFVRPHLQAIQSRSGQVQQTTMTQGKRIFDNQVAPILFGSLSKQIGELMSAALSLTPQEIVQANVRSRGINPLQNFSSDRFFSEGQIVSRGSTQDDTKSLLKEVVPGLGDIISIKNAVLADQLLNPRDLYAAAAQIELLTKALNNPTQRAQALNGVRTALDPNSPWTESLYIDIGMEILRVVGKNYLDSELPGGGSFLIRSAVEVLDFGEQTVGTVVQSVAGLVPEAGGIVSGIAKVTPDVIWKLAINNIIVGSVKGGAHYAYGKVIDEAKNALKTGQPYAAIQQHAGPLSALLRYLPSKQQIIILASTHTEDTRKALERYNQSVLQLAEAATR